MKKILVPFIAIPLFAACTQNTKTETGNTSTDSIAAASGSLKDPDYLAGTKFINDYPTIETVGKLYDEIDFQRACQVYIWAIPIVYMNELYVGFHRDLGFNFNDMNVLTAYAAAKNVGLTANNNTIYGLSAIDLSKGPVVIESPAGAYGVIDDWWQRPVTEVGPLGPDKGKGGKFLVLPPGYKEKTPAGYMNVPSTTNKVMYLARAFVRNGDIRAASNSLKTGVKIYNLSQAAQPPVTKMVDGSLPINTIAPRGFEYWQRLSDIINSEPVQERDRFFMAMLKPLGIEKGKPFNPGERQKRILTEAADVGFRMAQTISMAPRFDSVIAYPGTHWEYVLMLNPNQEAPGYSQLDERADYTFEAITVAAGMILKIPGAGSQYFSAAKDKDGEWLDGGKNYMLHIPANVPAKEFWSVIVYDNSTRSIIDNGVAKTSVSSNDKYQVNADSSIDVYFGPTAPAGKESNWVKTVPGKGWFVYFRWYSPTEAFFNKSWKLGDIEKVK